MCDCKCNEACKIDKYLDIEIICTKKCLFGKLVLAYEDEILYTTETSRAGKNNCFIYTISLVTICLSLLVATSISYYYCYTKYWI